MTQGIRQAISDLQSQLKYHQDAAARLSRAIGNLQDIPDIGKDAAPAKPAAKLKRKKAAASNSKPGKPGKPGKVKAKTRAATVKAVKTAKPVKTGRKKTTLAKALQYVLEEHRKAKTRGASAKQLLDEIQSAGFRFGGSNLENNMNYLYKTLRRNKSFKRVGDGLYGLA
jgi:FtsZ-interacting cell division protein ZipA